MTNNVFVPPPLIQLQWKKPEDLKPHPKNPNQHNEEQINRMAKVIKYQGFRRPIEISSLSGFIIAGHCRRLAAISLGMELVPTITQNYLSEEQEWADLISDNALSEGALMDMSLINAQLPEFGPELDIDLLGLKDFSIEPMDKGDFTICETCGHKKRIKAR